MSHERAVEDSPVSILMYHSISDGPPPLCMSPADFCTQLAVLAEHGYRTISAGAYAAWRRGERLLDGPSMVLTFDDGCADLVTAAAPAIAGRGWEATVFLPAALVGSDGTRAVGRCRIGPFMSWPAAAALGGAGIELGAHGLTHDDLTGLAPDVARDELHRSGDLIQERTGRAVTTFAPPFGHSNPTLRREIATRYACSVGTTMDRADAAADLYDLPRIDMHYFRAIGRWRDFVARGPTFYFARRRFLRGLRTGLTRRWRP